MNDLDVTTALRQAGMLADVSISTWGGTRTDNGLLNEVKRQHNAHGDVGRMMKNLLAGHDARLKAARGAYNAVRQRYYELTLPWTSDPHALRQTGPRLLTFPLFDNFMKEMAAAKRVAFDARDTFVEHYDEDAEAARGNLGGLVLETEYPSRDDVEAAFRIHFDIEPIPESSTFRGLPDLALNSLKKNLDKKREAQVKAAQSAAWAESRERVEHLIKRLTETPPAATPDKSPKFKNSTVENVRELLELLPGWNITDNPLVADIVGDLKQMLQNVTAESLRRDDALRAATAQNAQSVIDKMKGFWHVRITSSSYAMQWWETLTEEGLPRFYIFCSNPSTMSKGYRATYQHINVVELKPTTKNLPRSVRSAGVKQVLLHTVPLHLDTQGRVVWDRAERVVSKLNSMTLSVLAHENERKGISELFAHLWSEDIENNSC